MSDVVAQFAHMTGLDPEELQAATTEEADKLPLFETSNRTIEIKSVQVGDRTDEWPGDFRFVGIENGRLYFLRASRTTEENEQAAVQVAAQRLLSEQTEGVAFDTSALEAALVDTSE